MSGISAGIGLISGINTADLINQLMALEARPIRTLQQRVSAMDVERTAFLEIAAKLLAVKNSVIRFKELSLFRQFSVTSSNQDVLLATASESATPGSHTFRVRSLVANHSLVSRGFADASRTPVGTGTISIEIGRGSVQRATELSTLNGGAGVRRGVITITDRSGATTDIDLSTAVTIDDVLDAINSSRAINVRARVTGLPSGGATGDRIVIEDLTGLADGRLIIADKGGSFIAADLGIAADTQSDRVDGKDLVRLSMSTPLTLLNDGNGVGRLPQGRGDDILFSTAYGNFSVSLGDLLTPDTDLRVIHSGQGVRLGVIRITDRSGQSADIDLSNARTMGDVVAAIQAADVSVSVAITDSNLQIRDTSEVDERLAEPLKIEDVTGFAAADLGIAGEAPGDVITGADIHRVATVGDVIRAINFAADNNSLVEASISDDGKGITLRALGFDNSVTVAAQGNSSAAGDLGLLGAAFHTNTPLESRRLVAGLNTVLLNSLNGGTGVGVGTVRFSDGAARSATISFADASTLQDVIDLVNAETDLSLTAAINPAGNGIVIRDESGGNSPLIIEDVAGTLAADLGIAVAGGFDGSSSRNVVDGGNLQLQYVTLSTSLTDVISGGGFQSGEFRITDSTGAVHTIVVGANLATVGEVIESINLRTPDTIEARINATGDGIIVIDTSNGASALIIEDINGGLIAADLRLAGTAGPGENFIDGTAEIRIDISAGDTLDSVAAKLNAAGAGFTASVLNDGGAVNPYSLLISSSVSGRRGALVIDTGGTNLGLNTLSRAQDAIVTVGGDAALNPFVVVSPSNTLEGVVGGITLDLLAPGDQEVTITVAQNVDAIADSIRNFVDAYNEVQSTLDKNTSFNQDSLERGPLLGDPTVSLLRSRLRRVISEPFGEAAAPLSRLFSIGIRTGANNRLTFDEEKFLETYATNRELVEQLFTREETGIGAVLESVVDELTRSFDGVLARKDDLLADQQELLNDRIDRLNVLLSAKRARLEAQFIGLESALAALQNQQSALLSLASLAGNR